MRNEHFHFNQSNKKNFPDLLRYTFIPKLVCIYNYPKPLLNYEILKYLKKFEIFQTIQNVLNIILYYWYQFLTSDPAGHEITPKHHFVTFKLSEISLITNIFSNYRTVLNLKKKIVFLSVFTLHPCWKIRPRLQWKILYSKQLLSIDFPFYFKGTCPKFWHAARFVNAIFFF